MSGGSTAIDTVVLDVGHVLVGVDARALLALLAAHGARFESLDDLCRAADLCREKLKNPVRAEELFRRALVYSPNAREALEGLRGIYEGRNDAAALGEVLERLALVQSGPAAAALYMRAGELYTAADAEIQTDQAAADGAENVQRVQPADPLRDACRRVGGER